MPSSAAPGPVILISFESLRSDAVSGWGGPPGLTPHFEALARRVTWAGTGLASSGDPEPALASLLTGLEPRQHRVLAARSRLDRSLVTLAEAFRAADYTTAAYREFPIKKGWEQGIDLYRATARLHHAKEHLSGLTAAPSFTWIHFEALDGTLVRHDRFLRRLGRPAPQLPARLGAALRKQQIAAGLTALERDRIWALYCLNVAAMDEALGSLIAAFEASGQWQRSTFVVVGTQGMELEGPFLGIPRSLSRRALETPLLLQLPPGSPAITVEPGARVGLSRLFATLTESARIVETAASVAPSLFRSAPAGVPSVSASLGKALSFSWIEGDHQFLRIESAAGVGAPTHLLRWTKSGSEEIIDASLRTEMEDRMAAEYFFFEPHAGSTATREPPAVAAADSRKGSGW